MTKNQKLDLYPFQNERKIRERGGGENEGVREIERERKKRKKYWNIIWSK